MPLTRRRLLVAAASVPLAAAAARAVEVAGGALRSAAASLRPVADGTSATRCAQCGSPEHTMLDPDCPLAPRVRA